MKASSADPHRLRWLFFALLALLVTPLLADGDLSAHKREAGLPGTGAERLRALADDGRWEVREVLASNRRAPTDLLERLAADPDQRVRIAVATNLSTSQAVHMRLAQDADPQVRSVVARFEYLPVPVLMLLADDPLADIRLEVARSLNADEALLRKVMQDPDHTVSQTAEQALQALMAR